MRFSRNCHHGNTRFRNTLKSSSQKQNDEGMEHNPRIDNGSLKFFVRDAPKIYQETIHA